MIEKIDVKLANRSYNIFIGNDAIKKLPEFLETKNYSKIFLITDYNVANHHLDSIKKILPNIEYLIADSGEQTKAFQPLQDLCERILALGIDRNSLIIAFGGGVIGDLSGFAASILLRGVDFIQIPTTLLSMVDSSVGGKTGINCKSGKNLIGSFYQPKLVICDTNFLNSLSLRQIRAGYAEIFKYSLIADKNFYDFLIENFSKILLLEDDVIIKSIRKSCEIKAKIVNQDERESGLRMILNFGHTFAHVLEAETDYSNILNHGEAVAIGMVMAAKMSVNLKLLDEKIYYNIRNHIQECGFKINLRHIKNYWNSIKLCKYLAKDKKNEKNKTRYILLKNIGSATSAKLESNDEFVKVLKNFGAH